MELKTFKQFCEQSDEENTKYQEFFNKALKKFGVDSPDELEGEKEKEFYDYVDKNWESDSEEEVNESTIKGMTPKKLKLTSTKDLAAHTKKVTGKESLSDADLKSPRQSATKHYLKDGKKLGVTQREGKYYLTGLEVR